jgi:hypothetical protein
MVRRRRYLRRALRIVAGNCCVLAIALSVGAIYQAVVGNVDETRYPAPGRLVDIGGRRLHLYCIGEGSPTVILEAGLGWGLGTWRDVEPQVAQTTRVRAWRACTSSVSKPVRR